MTLYRPSPLELAGGFVPGLLPDPGADPAPGTARAAFDAALRPALHSTPCVVAFSGGRDSSAVLAAAVDLARREDLPLPVAAVQEFPGDQAADEHEWQDLILTHLGIRAVRIDGRSAADLLGEAARDALRRHGPLWPPMVLSRSSLLGLASGGSLLTGEGGDELLGPQRITPLVGTWRRRPRPSRRVLAATAYAVAPSPVRLRLLLREAHGRRPWLRPAAARAFARLSLRDEASRPLRWVDDVRHHRRARAIVLGHQTGQVLADEQGVQVAHPFLDAGFVDALAAEGAPRGWVSRTEAMTHLFGDLLPPALLSRTSKARFNRSAFGPGARDFVAGWDGSGVPDDLVEAATLRLEWTKDSPSAASLPLLQHAWWVAST